MHGTKKTLVKSFMTRHRGEAVAAEASLELLRPAFGTHVLISSGEAPLASFSEDGGVRARILDCWGSPFGEPSEQTAHCVRELNDQLASHYGHAGPLFVRNLVDMRQDREGLRNWYRELLAEYQVRAGSNAVASRMAAYFAVLEIAECLAHVTLQLPWRYQNTIANLWEELTADSHEADRSAAALRIRRELVPQPPE